MHALLLTLGFVHESFAVNEAMTAIDVEIPGKTQPKIKEKEDMGKSAAKIHMHIFEEIKNKRKMLYNKFPQKD